MQKLPNGNRVVFVHARDPQNTRTGVCHALEIDGSNKAIALGFALCNPKDNYNRKIGRTIAVSRLTSPEHRVDFEPTELKTAIDDCILTANAHFALRKTAVSKIGELRAAEKRIKKNPDSAGKYVLTFEVDRVCCTTASV